LAGDTAVIVGVADSINNNNGKAGSSGSSLLSDNLFLDS